jgi:hypothetical protein
MGNFNRISARSGEEKTTVDFCPMDIDQSKPILAGIVDTLTANNKTAEAFIEDRKWWFSKGSVVRYVAFLDYEESGSDDPDIKAAWKLIRASLMIYKTGSESMTREEAKEILSFLSYYTPTNEEISRWWDSMTSFFSRFAEKADISVHK